jgi:hypothetical protein
MIYRTMTLWEHGGHTWQALRGHENDRELSIGTLRPHEIDRSIKWAKSQGLTIVDLRKAA